MRRLLAVLALSIFATSGLDAQAADAPTITTLQVSYLEVPPAVEGDTSWRWIANGLVATVTSGNGAPSGVVTFLVGEEVACRNVPLQYGTARCSFGALGPGPHPARAEFTGATGWAPSTSGSVELQGAAGDPLVQVALSARDLGDERPGYWRLTATVTSAFGPPFGEVAFELDGALACPAVLLANGSTSCDVFMPGVGYRVARAHYKGGGGIPPADSADLVFRVAYRSSTSIASSVNPSYTTDRVTFTATISATQGTPTGTATFYNGSAPMPGCESVPVVVTGATTTQATCTLDGMPGPTRHTIAAQYNGSDAHTPSASALYQYVNRRPPQRVDFNGDGIADILWTNTDGRVATWTLDASGAHVGGTGLMTAGNTWVPAFIADFNGDGQADILWTNPDGGCAIWLLDATGQIGGARLMLAGSPWQPIAVGDFNGDGKADILWRHSDGSVALWLMDGAVQVGGRRLLDPSGWSVKHVADINNDGRADILWEHTDGRVALWLMDGTTQKAGVALLQASAPADRWTAKLVADFNGDGRRDILWTHVDGRVAYWLMGNGVQIGAAALLPAGSQLTPLFAGDITGDGFADIVWQAPNGDVTSTRIYGGVVGPSMSVLPGVSGASIVRMADFNGDLRADLLQRNADGSVAIRFGNADGSFSAPVGIFGAGTTWMPAPIRD